MPEYQIRDRGRDRERDRDYSSRSRYNEPFRDYRHSHSNPRPFHHRGGGFRPYFSQRGRGFRGRGGGYFGGNDFRHNYSYNHSYGRRHHRSRSRSPNFSERRERVVDPNIVPRYASDTGNPEDPMCLDIQDSLKELKRRSRVRRMALQKEYKVDDFTSVLSMCNSSFPEQEKGTRHMVDTFLRQTNSWKLFTDEATTKSHDTFDRKDDSDNLLESKPKDEKPVLEVKTASDDEDDEPRSRKFNPSLKPRNDYSQHYVDSDLRPQNFIHDSGYENRFREYPKLRELLHLKDKLVEQTNTPPMYLQCDLEKYNLKRLRSAFDVIMITPPLVNGYSPENTDPKLKRWTFEELSKLDIDSISANRGFIFMWCGTSENVDDCRECIHSWNYRRCEDICWIKTNDLNRDTPRRFEPGTLFHRTKEHCLVGIRGTVKRSQDGNFIHANTDLDLILSEEPEFLSQEKPEEIFKIIQHFCLGRRRLHLFGSDKDIRPGWLTVGPNVTGTNFDSVKYASWFKKEPDGKSIPDGYLTGCTDRIEEIRPKSPVRNVDNNDYKDPIPNTI